MGCGGSLMSSPEPPADGMCKLCREKLTEDRIKWIKDPINEMGDLGMGKVANDYCEKCWDKLCAEAE